MRLVKDFHKFIVVMLFIFANISYPLICFADGCLEQAGFDPLLRTTDISLGFGYTSGLCTADKLPPYTDSISCVTKLSVPVSGVYKIILTYYNCGSGPNIEFKIDNLVFTKSGTCNYGQTTYRSGSVYLEASQWYGVSFTGSAGRYSGCWSENQRNAEFSGMPTVYAQLQKSNLKMLDGADFSDGQQISTDTGRLISGGHEVSTAVADGATRLLLRIDVSEPGAANFSVTDATNGMLSKIDDQTHSSVTIANVRSVTTTGGEKIFAVYKVPDNFVSNSQDESTSTRNVTIHVNYVSDSGSSQDLTTTIKILRPPVVLIHGLWSGPEVWQDSNFEAYLKNKLPNILIYEVNYESTNASPFWVNLPIVASQIQIYIRQNLRRNSNIACTKVDVIAHSMGGVLSRLFYQQAYYKSRDNFKQGFIHKLITVDTPHYGALEADVISSIPLRLRQLVDPAFNAMGFPVSLGAIDDLSVQNLTSTTGRLRTCDIPGFTIEGDVTSELGKDILYDALPEPIGSFFQILDFIGYDPTFGLLEHDLIVEGLSQKGGMVNATQKFFHMHLNEGIYPPGPMENFSVRDKVLFLLNSDRNSNNFEIFR